jgi:hypothetical protein
VKNTISQDRTSFTLIFILTSLLVWFLASPHPAAAGYGDSAHGNSTYGVDRQDHSECPAGITCEPGDCTHCHDTFDPAICGQEDHPLMLFAVHDNDFCLKCHQDENDSPTYAASPIVNRSYSYRAGGYTTDTVNDIRQAFSLASSHDLDDINTFIAGKWGYTADSNACTACHNQHLVQGDPENAPNAAKSSGTRGWSVSLPSDHENGWELWGDDATERMDAYTSDYQAPYRTSPSAYEPDGSTTQDGSNLTDFNTFCTDCHNATDTIYSTALGRDLRQIDWDNEVHGKGNANVSLCGDNPYPSGASELVLSCLDCHEPHGSPNVTLIRKRVNAVTVSSITTISQDDCSTGMNINNEMSNLCNRCHNDDYQVDSSCSTNRWYKVHHKDTGDTGCNLDSPYRAPAGGCTGSACHYKTTMSFGCNVEVCNSLSDRTCFSRISCNCCHYHGSYVDVGLFGEPYYEPKYRRTF